MKAYDLSALRDGIISAVTEAGYIMTDLSAVKEDDITSKEGNGNFVTRFDVAVQEHLIRSFSALLPEALYFAEEKEYNVLTDAPTFIIDPIDGTTNFILDFKHSAISVALCIQKKAVIGVVYNPYQKELFYAVCGEGAFLRRDGKETKLHVKDTPLRDALVIFGTDPYRKSKTEALTVSLFRHTFHAAMDLRRVGSAALDLSYIAAGRAQMFFEGLLSPWDYAAGGLILTEAGGSYCDDRGALPLYVKSPIFAGTPTALREYCDKVIPRVEKELGKKISDFH